MINAYNMSLQRKLNKRQVKKFTRDKINLHTRDSSILPQNSNNFQHTAKIHRSRRFKRNTVAKVSNATTIPEFNPVLNVSRISLSEAEISPLSKGLNFCPTPWEIDDKAVREDAKAFFRRLRLKELFSWKDTNIDVPSQATETSELERLYKPKSTCEPPPGKCGALESYIEAVQSNIESLLFQRSYIPDNLSKAERTALQSLKDRDDIVIKKADKGSTVVVLDKDSYIAEANRQLSNERFYQKLDTDTTEEFSVRINDTLKEMYD
jgi:hypothetical protein